MESLVKGVKQFVAEEEGAAMVEYGLLVALIAVVVAVAAKLLGTEVATVFTNVCATLKGGAC